MGFEDIPNEEVIQKNVFSMGNDKSPGPNGLSPFLFKFYWEIIKAKVIYVVKFFFREGYMIKPLNHIFVTMIPKMDKPNVVEHFPIDITLYIVYKIITKFYLIG